MAKQKKQCPIFDGLFKSIRLRPGVINMNFKILFSFTFTFNKPNRLVSHLPETNTENTFPRRQDYSFIIITKTFK